MKDQQFLQGASGLFVSDHRGDLGVLNGGRGRSSEEAKMTR